MEKNIPITIVCRPRGDSKRLVTEANDAASSIASCISQVLTCAQNLPGSEVSYILRHVRNDRNFCYQYDLSISATDEYFSRHGIFIVNFLNEISCLVATISHNVESIKDLSETELHLNRIDKIMSLNKDENYKNYTRKTLQKLYNDLTKAAVRMEILFHKDLQQIDEASIGIYPDNGTNSTENEPITNPLTLFGNDRVERTNPVEKPGDASSEEKTDCIENICIKLKAEYLQKHGHIALYPCLNGKRIAIEGSFDFFEKLLSVVINEIENLEIEVTIDIAKTVMNTYKGYDVIGSVIAQELKKDETK